LAQLQRGYAMVRTPERRPLRSAQDLQAGDPLEVHLPDGTVHAEVRSISRRDLGTPD
jgi:exonuclease VII large subunit